MKAVQRQMKGACLSIVWIVDIKLIIDFGLLLLQVDAEEKKKKKTGRAKRRMLYNRRFVNVVPTFGKRRGPNSNS